MPAIVYTDQLDFEGGRLPAHLASDRQIYIRLDDLCNLIGLDPGGIAEGIQHDITTADLLLYMAEPGDDPLPRSQEPPGVAFLNLAALPYWLGKISSEGMQRPDLHSQLVRYTFDFLDTSWMFYRAAVRDLEKAAVDRTRIAGTRNRAHLPRPRPRY